MHLKNVLPEEILLRIFSEIERVELRRMLGISYEWRDLLIKNVKVMRKLPLMLINDTWRGKLEFVEIYGKYVREIRFESTDLESFEDVANILRKTPNVEKISLLKVKVPQPIEENSEENLDGNGDELQTEKIILKKLWKVTIDDDENVGTLNFFATNCDAKLTNLKCDVNCKQQQKVLERLMSESYQLRDLELFTTIDEIFDPMDETIEGFACQLERLHVKSSILKFNDQFFKFLKSQRRLVEVGLDASHTDFRYQRTMLTAFPVVRRLNLNIDSLCTSDCLEKLKRIPPNKSIQCLTVLGQNRQLNVFETVLKLCPQLQQLSIENLTQFQSGMIRTLPLTYIKVDRVAGELLKHGQMTQSAKIDFGQIIPCARETFERNLQRFCDLNRHSDKSKDLGATIEGLEAF